MKERIRIRRDSANNWTFYNPVLATGEAGYETDTNRLKIGNGSLSWSELPYLVGGSTSVLKFGDGGISDTLLWYTSDRLNLVGSGGTSIYFDTLNNTIRIGSPTGTSITKSSITGTLGYTPQPSGNYAILGHSHSIPDISGLSQLLDSKQPTGLYASGVHKHQISDVSGLGLALSTKQPSGNYALSDHIHQLFISDGLNRVITYNSNDDLKIRGSGGTSILFNDTTNTITIGSVSTIGDLTNVVLTTGNQTISGVKLFNNSGIFNSGLVSSGNILLKLPITTDTPLNIPVFISDPSSSSQLLYNIPFIKLVPSGRNISAGSGLIGGGFLNSDLSINVGQGDGILVNDSVVSVNSTVVRTTGNQTINGIKTFTTGIFTHQVSSPEGVFQNLFTNSIGLTGDNNKIFLTAGTGISFYFHDADNILEISADASVESIGDTMVLRDMQGNVFFNYGYSNKIYTQYIYGTGSALAIMGNNGLILDPSNMVTSYIGDGSNNVIIGYLNDGYGGYDPYVQMGAEGPYLPSNNIFCIGLSNKYKDSSQSFVIGNNSSSVSSSNSVAIGNNALISNSGQMSYSNGKFQYDGDSQKITYLARGMTTGDNSCVLTLDGNNVSATNIFALPPQTTWAFYGQISAYDYLNGYGAAFNIRGGIRRNQNDETKLIGSFIKESWIEPELEGIYVSITANNDNNTLNLEALGKSGSNIKWTCELNIIQNSNSDGIL